MAVWLCMVFAALGQGFGLRNGIGNQHPVAGLPGLIRRYAAWCQRHHDIQRDNVASLMQRLKEAVLAPGPCCPPDHRRCRIVKHAAISAHALAVGFHFQLLQPGRHQRQPLVIRHDPQRWIAHEITIPDPQQSKNDWQVFGMWCGFEMAVHRGRALQQLGECCRPDINHHRQADSRP